MKPWLVTFLRRLFGWTENGCERTSPSAEPRLHYHHRPIEGRAMFKDCSQAPAHRFNVTSVGACSRSWVSGRGLHVFDFRWVNGANHKDTAFLDNRIRRKYKLMHFLRRLTVAIAIYFRESRQARGYSYIYGSTWTHLDDSTDFPHVWSCSGGFSTNVLEETEEPCRLKCSTKYTKYLLVCPLTGKENCRNCCVGCIESFYRQERSQFVGNCVAHWRCLRVCIISNSSGGFSVPGPVGVKLKSF